jgi:formate hydrogenlyase subunit 3/multisubunit Na+/H+ antiporter MnhD subunit
MSLTKQETDFIAYWQANRGQKKKFLRQFSLGLPLGVAMVLAIFINIFSGWNKRVEMIVRGDASSMYMVIIAVVAIVIFMTIFSSRYKWEQNEQRYQELKQKQQAADAANS